MLQESLGQAVMESGGSSVSGGGLSILRASVAATAKLSDVLVRLGANTGRGLSEQQVEERRKIHGLNEFTLKEDDPLWRKYLNQVCLASWAVRLGIIWRCPSLVQ